MNKDQDKKKRADLWSVGSKDWSQNHRPGSVTLQFVSCTAEGEEDEMEIIGQTPQPWKDSRVDSWRPAVLDRTATWIHKSISWPQSVLESPVKSNLIRWPKH